MMKNIVILEEIKHNELISKKHKKACMTLGCVELLLILASTVTRCASISAFASLVGVPVSIASSAATIKICIIATEIKTYKSIVKKERKKHDKIVLLGKAKLNAVEILNTKALINSCITHGKFVSVNNVLRKYNEAKQEINILKRLWNIIYKYG